MKMHTWGAKCYTGNSSEEVNVKGGIVQGGKV